MLELEKDYDNIILNISDNISFNKLSENEFIVSNTKNKHYLKINTESYSLLLLFDGEKTLKEVINCYNAMSGNKIDNSQKFYFFLKSKFFQFGIFSDKDKYIKKYEKPQYLKLSFIIFNQKFLNKIVPNLYFLFYKRLGIAIISISLFFLIVINYINFDVYKKINLSNSILLFSLLIAISKTLHEIGHATSASYFGAKHGGIGGGFYLFTPVYFADVTDIWKLSKTKRIIVNLAGIYFEIIFCCLILIFAIIFKNNLLAVLSTIVVSKTILNLNPFVRSDGYWVVSDLINKPNLFLHSKNKIFELYRIIRYKKKINWIFIDFFMFIYGVFSFSFIFIFLYYILIKNPNSIIFFPFNIYDFITGIFSKKSTSIIDVGKLIPPLMFYYLLFILLKNIFSKYFNKNS